MYILKYNLYIININFIKFYKKIIYYQLSLQIPSSKESFDQNLLSFFVF